MSDASLEIKIGANVTQAKKGLNDVEKGLTDLGGASKKAAKDTGGFFTGFTQGLAGLVAVGGITQFARKIFDVTAEFEKLGVVLANTLGSDQLAKKAFADIEAFASTTPFSVAEVTASFVKLANQGFVPTVKELRNLGDLAASTGKGFDQLAEAILDAQTGEFERLKEFGVRAQDAGDKVIFTFKGVSTEVSKTSSAIRGYITGLGELNGISGATEKISKTLSGQVSNLGDSFDRLFNTIGSAGSGFLNDFISTIGKGIDQLNTYLKRLSTISDFNLGKTGDFRDQVNAFFGFGKTADAAFNVEDLQRGLEANYNDALKAAKVSPAAFAAFNKAIADGIVKPRLLDAAKRGIDGEKAAILKLYSDFGQSIADALKASQKKVTETPFGGSKDAAAEALKKAKEAIADQIAILKTEQLQVDDTTLTYKRLESRIVTLQGQYNALGKTAAQAAFELANAAKQAELLTRNPTANIPTALAPNDPEVLKIDTSKALAGIRELKAGIDSIEPFEGIKKQLIDINLLAQGIGQNIANAFSTAFEQIANGENAFKALGEAVKKVVRDLIAAVIQAIVLKAVMSAIGGGGGSIISGVFNYGANVGGVNPGGLAGSGAGNFAVSTTLSGQDIILAIQRTSNNNGING